MELCKRNAMHVVGMGTMCGFTCRTPRKPGTVTGAGSSCDALPWPSCHNRPPPQVIASPCSVTAPVMQHSTLSDDSADTSFWSGCLCDTLM